MGAEAGAKPLEPTPEEARRVFGSTLPRAEAYAGLLVGPGVQRGLLGPREPGRIWDRHLLNCAALAPLLPRRGRIVDLGSGAGLPGVVLAILRPELQFVLVDAALRRVHFLHECVEQLALANVQVVRARVEELRGKGGFDVAVARAVASLDRLWALALPLLIPGGHLLALKGSHAQDEVVSAATALTQLGAESCIIRSCSPCGSSRSATVVDVRLRIQRSAQKTMQR